MFSSITVRAIRFTCSNPSSVRLQGCVYLSSLGRLRGSKAESDSDEKHIEALKGASCHYGDSSAGRSETNSQPRG